MANTFLVISDITREVQRVLHERMTFCKTINNQFDNMAESGGGKNGGIMRIRTPAKYTVRSGRVMDIQDSTDTSVTLTVATQTGCDLGNFTSAELANSIDDVSNRYIKPAVSVIASNIEKTVLQGVTQAVYQTVGTAGTTPATMTVWGEARAKLNQQCVPYEDRSVQLSSVAMASMVDSYKGLFAPSPSISKQYLQGYISTNSGFDWYENERGLVVTNGSDVAGTVNETTVADGDAEMTVTGFSAALATGSVFTVAGVYDVHPETKESYSHLKQFVVLTGTTTTLLKFSPAVYASGANQNVSALPSSSLSSGTITPVGSASVAYPYHLAYHKDIAVFATQDLPLPKNFEAMRKKIDDVSVRVILNAYDVVNDTYATRIDILWGYATIRPEMGCRVVG